MALVRAFVNLELDGVQATHQGWDQLNRRLHGEERSTDGFGNVQFPFRLGEHHRLNDGVVGYWLEEWDGSGYAKRYKLTQSDIKHLESSHSISPPVVSKLKAIQDEQLIGEAKFDEVLAEILTDSEYSSHRDAIAACANEAADFYAPQSEQTTALSKDDNFIIYKDAGGPLNFFQSIDDASQFASILMDPRGLVHCTTGVLPTKDLSIPPEHYVEQLQKLSVTFLSAPVLADPGKPPRIPMPVEPGYEWSWIQKDGAAWTETGISPVISRDEFWAAFEDGVDLWGTLLSYGWIEPPLLGSPDGVIVAVPKRKKAHLPDPRQAEIRTLLHGKTTVAQTEFAKYPDHEALWDSLVAANWLTSSTGGSATVSTAANLAPFTDTREPDIERFLQVHQRALRQPHDHAAPAPAKTIREGWLQLNVSPSSKQ
ncbi:MAG: hypothetical protein AAF585_28510 [Verrucomicrobiota bacterium]